MKTVKVKTGELAGPALDWAVRTCQGWRGLHWHTYTTYEGEPPHKALAMWPGRNWQELSNMPVDWEDAGHIIEREEIDIYCHESPKSGCGWWVAEITSTKARARGNTPLIAAMRCYVASKLGDEIEISEELK